MAMHVSESELLEALRRGGSTRTVNSARNVALLTHTAHQIHGSWGGAARRRNQGAVVAKHGSTSAATSRPLQAMSGQTRPTHPFSKVCGVVAGVVQIFRQKGLVQWQGPRVLWPDHCVLEPVAKYMPATAHSRLTPIRMLIATANSRGVACPTAARGSTQARTSGAPPASGNKTAARGGW